MLVLSKTQGMDDDRSSWNVNGVVGGGCSNVSIRWDNRVGKCWVGSGWVGVGSGWCWVGDQT